MRISAQNFSCNSANNTNFKGTNPLKKAMPWVFGGAIAIGGLNACDSFERISDTEVSNGLNVEYTNVEKETRDSVMKPVYELKSKLKAENDFLDGVTVSIANSFKNLDNKNSFNRYVKECESDESFRGTSFYSDSKSMKYIGIQEAGMQAFKSIDKTGKETIIPAMRQTLMHEVGHHFDNYFGHDHNADYALKWDSILNSHEKRGDLFTFKTYEYDEHVAEKTYYANNSLSDSKEFKTALKKDINSLKNQKELPKTINNYLNSSTLHFGISTRQLEIADGMRAEIYANLFSYLTGQDEGERKIFLKCFSESKKVVEKDMIKYLKLVK